MKENKDSYIRFRIDKETKEALIKILDKQGDTMSGFLTRMIYRYINQQKENNN